MWQKNQKEKKMFEKSARRPLSIKNYLKFFDVCFSFRKTQKKCISIFSLNNKVEKCVRRGGGPTPSDYVVG